MANVALFRSTYLPKLLSNVPGAAEEVAEELKRLSCGDMANAELPDDVVTGLAVA